MIIASSLVAAKAGLKGLFTDELTFTELSVFVAAGMALEAWLKPREKWKSFMTDREDSEDLYMKLQLVTDKSWGHGYYGCAGCCGYEGQRLLPNPFAGGVGTQGNNTAESEDMCSDSWVDLTSEAYDWASTNSGIVNLPTANITQDQVSVHLSGPSGVTGNLTVTLNGPSSVTLAQANNVAAGTYNYTFNRPSLPAGEYTSVSASWTAGEGASANVSVSFNVLGLTRFSTYNTPYENQCGGGSATAYIFINNPQSCTYSQTSLNSTFMSQVGINGTGSSISQGIVKVFNATAVGQSCELPPGGVGSGNSANTFVAVTSITGACNATMSAGNLAVNPDPVPANASRNCTDQVLLINGSDQSNSTGAVADYCPACSSGFNGTSGHIDRYSSSQSCTAHNFTDYGNFYAIRLR